LSKLAVVAFLKTGFSVEAEYLLLGLEGQGIDIPDSTAQ
jgi:hypothetical protein